jgi:tetratricopeptide (TPR) repeat protein
MEDAAVRQFRDAIERGVAEFNQGNQPAALKQFEDAVRRIDQITSNESRRFALRETALMLVRARFAQMGRRLAQRAVDLDQQIGNPRHAGQDLLTLGWAELQLGELATAEKTFQTALDLALQNGDYDTAAGASTNLAIAIGARDRPDRLALQRAISLLRNSLSYLEKRSNDEFEIITRVALVQALEAAQAAPLEIFPVARRLFDRFANDLRKDQWDATLGPLRQAAQRHLQTVKHPDPQAWMRQNFPELVRAASAR